MAILSKTRGLVPAKCRKSFTKPLITEGKDEVVGHIAYNGNFFPGKTWKPGTKPLYDATGVTRVGQVESRGIDNAEKAGSIPAPATIIAEHRGIEEIKKVLERGLKKIDQ